MLSIVPRTLTRPRVPKYSAEPGMTTSAQPPFSGDCTIVAMNVLSNVIGVRSP